MAVGPSPNPQSLQVYSAHDLDLAQPQNGQHDKLAHMQRLGRLLAASGYFADARDMAQAAVKVMAGEELGVPPIASMMGINIIKGRIALSGNLIASRIRAHGYDYRVVRLDHSGCVLRFFGKAHEALHPDVEFLEEDAKRAGVFAANETYKKYPRAMYFNRAISMGARLHTPEVFGGAPVYTPEELGAPVDEDGNVLSQPAAPPPDTGGHPNGTQAAANHVRDRKLEEIRKEQAAAAPAPSVPPAVEAMWKVMAAEKRDGFAKVFQALFESMVELAGERRGSEVYNLTLGLHGVDSWQQFKSLKKAQQCVLMLHEKREALAHEPPPDMTDEDAPFEDRQTYPDAEGGL